jgi:hypothetical protein
LQYRGPLRDHHPVPSTKQHHATFVPKLEAATAISPNAGGTCSRQSPLNFLGSSVPPDDTTSFFIRTGFIPSSPNPLLEQELRITFKIFFQFFQRCSVLNDYISEIPETSSELSKCVKELHRQELRRIHDEEKYISTWVVSAPL